MKRLFVLPTLALVALATTSSHAAEPEGPAVPELSQEYVQHCYSLTMNALMPYAAQLEQERRKAFICHELFSFFETEITDSKEGYAVRNFLRDAKAKPWVDDVPNVLDSYSYRDSEIEKLQVVLRNFDTYFYGKPSKRGSVYKPFLLKTADVSTLDVNFLLQGWSGYRGRDSHQLSRASAALGYAAYRALDATKLRAELAEWGIDTPAYTRVVTHWLKLAGEVCAHLDTLAASTAERSPAMAKVFSEAAATYQKAASAATTEQPFLKLQNDIIARLLKGDTPAASECEEPLLTGYGRLAKEPWLHGLKHPLASRARELAETCAKSRDWALRTLVRVMAPEEYALSPFAFVALSLRKHDEKIAEDLGETVKFAVTSRYLQQKYGPSTDGKRRAFVDATDMTRQEHDLHDGAIKIVAMKPMTIAGAEFVLVGGKAKKVKIPKWNCTLKRIGGWEVSGNEIRRRTSRNCKKVGTQVVPANTYLPMLVPKMFAGSLKKGSWYKFLRRGLLSESTGSRERRDGGKVHPDALSNDTLEALVKPIDAFTRKHKLVDRSVGVYANSVRYAVPVCVSKKSDACATLGTDGEPFDAEAFTSYRHIF